MLLLDILCSSVKALIIDLSNVRFYPLQYPVTIVLFSYLFYSSHNSETYKMFYSLFIIPVYSKSYTCLACSIYLALAVGVCIASEVEDLFSYHTINQEPIYKSYSCNILVA